MLIGEKLDKPVPTNDPSVREERLCISGQKNNRRIQLANAKFFAQSPAERRVGIAKDVLKWLEIKKLVPTVGQYIGPKSDPLEPDRVNGETCNVCALGALFACTVERAGGVSNFWNLADLYGNKPLRTYLSPHFSEEQLGLVECAFECCAKYGIDPYNDASLDAEAFGINASPRYIDGNDSHELCRERDSKRMVAIMENIIENAGTFVPGSRTAP